MDQCLKDNFLTCAPDCFKTQEQTFDTTIVTCSDVESKCQGNLCCSPCVSATVAYFECESSARGCGKVCANAAPATPSPRLPVSPAAANACYSEFLEAESCFRSDVCPNTTDTIYPITDSCDKLEAVLCSSETECSPCAKQSIAYFTCYADLVDCPVPKCSSAAWEFANTSTFIAALLSFLCVLLLHQETIL
jgi:hypothetical protein